MLSPDQRKLLQDAASLEFSLGGFKSLDDIITSLKVDVVIGGDVKYHEIPRDLINAAERYWREKYEEAANFGRKKELRGI